MKMISDGAEKDLDVDGGGGVNKTTQEGNKKCDH